ncbi:MAG: hypothetical protein FWE07_00280 [Turicibacter sp.]|nr:hypothetical protein [Turicibacter sp.]
MKKKTFLMALALFLSLGLVACGNDDNGDDAYENDTEEVADEDEEDADEDDNGEDEVDAAAHATSRGGLQDGEELADALSADSEGRAWVAGLAADIEMEGPLYIEGDVERHSGGEWTEVYARKVGFYQRDEIGGVPRVPVGAWTLTVANGIIVNSPGTFFIAEGPFIGEVHGDVYVNVPYFRLSGVRIHGDIIFANEHYRDTATAQIWDSEIAAVADEHDGEYDGITLYQSNLGTGFGTISHADATQNVSNVDFSELVTGEIRIATAVGR